ncbi:MAG: hypothetical protein KKE91_02875 [Candidatus Omnitrophica bacterium]|nr:hypothetical protein [Candidatus Omnitrophota bacterium]
MDIDHILDYYLQQGFTLRIKTIYFWICEREFEFVFLFFHSLELLFIIWVIISVFRLGIYWVVFAIGITQHMILDMLFNQNTVYSYSYFLSYRIIKGFKKEYLFRPVALEK